MVVAILGILLAIYYFIQQFKPSSIGVYHCICEIPEFGKKEVVITVQVIGEKWSGKILGSTNVTLNILGYYVPCSCTAI